jgi:hypothetical protein
MYVFAPEALVPTALVDRCNLLAQMSELAGIDAATTRRTVSSA